MGKDNKGTEMCEDPHFTRRTLPSCRYTPWSCPLVSRQWPPTRALKGLYSLPLLLCSAFAFAQAAPDGAVIPALDWQQSQQRLEQVSDALAAADASVRNNVSRTVGRLRDFSEPMVLERIRSSKLRVVGARYDLDDGRVDFFDEGPIRPRAS